MKDRELKTRIKAAYRTEATESQRRFLRDHQQRELKFSRLLLLQPGYMKLPCALIGAGLLGFLASALCGADAEKLRTMAAFLPFLALLSLSDLGASERCGMGELEMSSRFSLRLLKAARLTLVGILTLVSVGVCALVLRSVSGVHLPFALLLAGFPYLITAASCMALLRLWHAKENIYGCAVIAACVSLLSLALENGTLLQVLALCRRTCLALLLAALYLVAREMTKYLKESEELQWSLSWTE